MSLLGFVAVVVAVVTIPTAIYAAVRAVNAVLGAPEPRGRAMAGVDERLRRLEEAIDAMSQQIERLRVSDRYVEVERAAPRPLPPPTDDPPTFR